MHWIRAKPVRWWGGHFPCFFSEMSSGVSVCCWKLLKRKCGYLREIPHISKWFRIWGRFLTFEKCSCWHSNSASIAFDGRLPSSTPSHCFVHRLISAEITTWLSISSWYWVSKWLIWSSVASGKTLEVSSKPTYMLLQANHLNSTNHCIWNRRFWKHVCSQGCSAHKKGVGTHP